MSYSEKDLREQKGTEEIETSTTTPCSTGVVWVDISSVDNVQSQPTKINVRSNDDIDSIKTELKTKCENLLRKIDAPYIMLYESEGTEPLDAETEWNPNVPWGTRKKPLIIQILGMFFFKGFVFFSTAQYKRNSLTSIL
jgi:hypothetical protein